MCSKEGCGPEACNCPGARVERFIQPCMLLLLAERSTHGYNLIERLPRFGFEGGADPAAVYRNLRRLEQDGLVTSAWETSGTGPAKRLYAITSDGWELLEAWSSSLANHKDHIEDFLNSFAVLKEKQSKSESKEKD